MLAIWKESVYAILKGIPCSFNVLNTFKKKHLKYSKSLNNMIYNNV